MDIIQSNSMVEAANKIIKYRYLFPKPIMDTSELIKTLELAVENYNNMPNGQLHGFSPNEVLTGTIPDKHFFKSEIHKAKQVRIAANRNVACELVCQTWTVKIGRSLS